MYRFCLSVIHHSKVINGLSTRFQNLLAINQLTLKFVLMVIKEPNFSLDFEQVISIVNACVNMTKFLRYYNANSNIDTFCASKSIILE